MVDRKIKIAIVNDVHIGKALERNQVIRAASHLVEEALPHVLRTITEQHSPDLIVNLGDLIRSESKAEDLKRYRKGISSFTQLTTPVLHLLGNHELKQMTTQEVEGIWREAGFPQKSYGIRKIGNYNILWIGLAYQPEKRFKHYLSDEELEWLAETLTQLKEPTILLSHCALDDQAVEGNYFYEGYNEKNSDAFFLENGSEIRDLLRKSSQILIVIQAHLHYFHTKLIGPLPFVTCPALGDNLCAPTFSNHIPEIYSLLTLSPEQIVLKSYSREFCFAGFEFSR